MLANSARASRAATCEEWDEDAQTTLPDTRTSANVAAKRSKPELVPTKSHRVRPVGGDGEKMSRRSTSTQDDASLKKDKRSSGLKLTTSFPDRESRPYSSGPPRELPLRSASRPAAKRSNSKAEKLEPLTIHRSGECRICDVHGYHAMVPPEAQRRPSKEKAMPQSPLATSQQLSQQTPTTTKRLEASKVEPRPNRPQLYRDQRPMSFHAGMSYEAYHPYPSQPFSALEWNMPPNPISAYPQMPSYAQTPTMPFETHYPDYSQSFPMQYNQQAAPPPRPRLPEPRRGTTARAQPIIQQSPVSSDQPPLTRTVSHREHRRTRDPALSREEDARRMPPPKSIPVARRPSVIKANTSISTPVSYQPERRSSNDGFVPAPLLYKERKPDPPPSSYRKPSASSYYKTTQDRPVPPKSKTYQDGRQTTKVDSSGPSPDRRVSLPGAERNEIEAEDYQRLRGTKTQPLTVDAISKISRHSDSGSQRSINTSSRGSSGGKTKATVASNDITLQIYGVTLGISGDSAETRCIKIQPKGNGGLNISVDEQQPSGRDNKVTSLQKRSGSTTSSSKQSRRSSEKEVRRSRDQSLDRELDQANNASNRSSKAFYDDAPGYGYGYG